MSPPTAPRLIVVGASLGGLKTLRVVLGALPAGFLLPLAVAQHRHPSGGDVLEVLLGEVCALPVKEAQDKTPVEPGTVTLAPADYHLLVEGEHFALMAGESTDTACPSIDALFESAAEAMPAAALSATGLAAESLPLARIAPRLLELAGT